MRTLEGLTRAVLKLRVKEKQKIKIIFHGFLIPGKIRLTPKIENSNFPRYIIVAKCLVSSWLVAG